MFVKISNNAIFAASKDFSLVCQCPDGEIGKRCGLRSRWSTILESSSLSSGTSKLKSLQNIVLQAFVIYKYALKQNP